MQKVHLEDETPYYTVLIAVTGREKNTDRAHLRHKGAQVWMGSGVAWRAYTRQWRCVWEILVP